MVSPQLRRVAPEDDPLEGLVGGERIEHADDFGPRVVGAERQDTHLPAELDLEHKKVGGMANEVSKHSDPGLL